MDDAALDVEREDLRGRQRDRVRSDRRSRGEGPELIGGVLVRLGAREDLTQRWRVDVVAPEEDLDVGEPIEPIESGAKGW